MEVLRRQDWEVRTVPLKVCERLVAKHHYAHRGPNTATFRHGLFRRDDAEHCWGVAWWIPPTKGAALATWPPNWQGVLALTRLVLIPDAPKNAATFMLMHSVKLIRQDRRWECLVTYADEWQNHVGTIYKAAGWEYLGLTKPETTWQDREARLVQRKRGPKTLTRAEMLERGYTTVGAFSKHKFILRLDTGPRGGQG